MWVSVAARWSLRARLWVQATGSLRGPAWGRNSSGGARGAGPVVEELEEIIRAEKRKLRAIKFRRIRAELGLSGALPRSLTSEAMQQIRFLRERFPEEWNVSQLAEGFSVSEDVIRRVLRSKFTPSLQRRMKQDANARAATLTLSPRAKQLTVDSPSIKALVKSEPITDEAVTLSRCQGAVTFPVRSDLKGRVHKPTVKETGRMDLVQQRVCKQLRIQSSPDMMKTKSGRKVASHEERDECDETCNSSDGEQLLAVQGTDEELQKLTASGSENQMKVVQKGYEFYDQEGNFLYRISNVDSLNNPKQET
ncbi:neugrin [Heterodontus francisci]|uniref:neugrin n=1 Tax=Heterodontus francisci TaxID=7792 RepID=UPI00355C23DB